MNKKPIVSDLARIDRMRDSDIDYSDIPEFDQAFLDKPAVPWPPASRKPNIGPEKAVHLEKAPRAAA